MSVFVSTHIYTDSAIRLKSLTHSIVISISERSDNGAVEAEVSLHIEDTASMLRFKNAVDDAYNTLCLIKDADARRG